MNPRLLPCAMIALSLGAACAYAYVHDWRRMAYWAAAAVLTASVTY